MKIKDLLFVIISTLFIAIPLFAQEKKDIKRVSLVNVEGLFIGQDDVLFGIDNDQNVRIWDGNISDLKISSLHKTGPKSTGKFNHLSTVRSGASPILKNSIDLVKMAVANKHVQITLNSEGRVIEYWRRNVQELQGRATDIGGGLDNYFYKIDKQDNKIYKRGHTASLDNKWNLFKSQPPIVPRKIAVSKNGNPWVLDQKGEVYSHRKGKWTHRKGIRCSELHIDKKDQVFAVTYTLKNNRKSSSNVSKYNFKTKKWDKLNIRSSAIASDGIIMYFSSGSKGISSFDQRIKFKLLPNLLFTPLELKHYQEDGEFTTNRSTEPGSINLTTGPRTIDFEMNTTGGRSDQKFLIQVAGKPFGTAENSAIIEEFTKEANTSILRFRIDFEKYKYHMPPIGDPFHIRAIQVQGSENKLISEPSNTIKIFWSAKNLNNFSFIDTKEIRDVQKPGQPPRPKGRDVQIFIADLQCEVPNEYEKGDISISANNDNGDEPYYVGFSFNGTISNLEVKNVFPFSKKFHNVKTGESVNARFPILPQQVFPPKPGEWHYLVEDEFLGYGLQLWEWDESDASERYADMTAMLGFAAVGAAAIFTKGASVKDFSISEKVFKESTGAINSFWKLLEEVDGDDLIDSTGLAFDLNMLEKEYWNWHFKTEKGVRSHSGEMLYPHLKVAHQMYADLSYFFYLEGADARYRMEIIVRTPNPQYIGPYKE